MLTSTRPQASISSKQLHSPNLPLLGGLLTPVQARKNIHPRKTRPSPTTSSPSSSSKKNKKIEDSFKKMFTIHARKDGTCSDPQERKKKEKLAAAAAQNGDQTNS